MKVKTLSLNQILAYSIYLKILSQFIMCSIFKNIRIIFLSSLNSVYLHVCVCVYVFKNESIAACPNEYVVALRLVLSSLRAQLQNQPGL